MKAILTVGISGSGKSTWAARQWDENYDERLTVINRDDARWEISGRRGWNGLNAYKFNSRTESQVTSRNNDKIVLSAVAKRDIIISDTNLNPIHRAILIETCEFLGYKVEIKEFPISFQEALKRDAERGIYAVGKDVLEKQWEAWIKYNETKGGAW